MEISKHTHRLRNINKLVKLLEVEKMKKSVYHCFVCSQIRDKNNTITGANAE